MAATKRSREVQDAIEIVLSQAHTPLSSVQIAQQAALLGVDMNATDVAQVMVRIMRRMVRKTTICRMPADKVLTGRDSTRWMYYDSTVMNPHTYAGAPQPPVLQENKEAAPKAPELSFDPLPEALVSPIQTPVLAAPQAARAVVVTLAGVTIRIELNC